MSGPDPIRAQRLRALERGNAVRLHRQTIHRQIRGGTIDLPTMLRFAVGDDPVAEGMTIESLLLAVPGIGPHTAGRIIHEHGWAGRLTLSALTAPRRRDLADTIERHLQ